MLSFIRLDTENRLISAQGSEQPHVRTGLLSAAAKGVLIAVFLVGCCSLLLLPRYYLPAEDAIILHAYSSHLAHEGTIAFYTGGPRAEGATDFLWMVLLAGAIRLHAHVLLATEVLNVVSLLAIGWCLVRLSGSRLTASRVLALAALPFFWPQMVAAAAGFSVLPFAALLLLLALCAAEGRDGAAALTCLVLCLFRPDGVVFAVPFAIYRLFAAAREGRAPVAVQTRYLLLFAAPGLVYFFWRWHYFQELFPLPFLVKSDTRRHLLFLVPSSVTALLPYLLLLALTLALAWKALRRSPMALGLVAATAGLSTVFYAAMRLDQNNGDRFFVYLPVAVALTVALAWRTGRWTEGRTALVAGASLLLFAWPMQEAVTDFLNFNRFAHSLQQIAAEMHRRLPRGSMIVTEAGLTPYYSDWVAYDAWGLNTREFAKRLIAAEDVASLHPDLILLHQPRETQAPCAPSRGATGHATARSQANMTDNLLVGTPATWDAWLLPYRLKHQPKQVIQPEGGVVLYQCWLVNPAYSGRAGLEELLRSFGGYALPRRQ